MLAYDEIWEAPTTRGGAFGRKACVVDGSGDRVFQEWRFRAINHAISGHVCGKCKLDRRVSLFILLLPLSLHQLQSTFGDVMFARFLFWGNKKHHDVLLILQWNHKSTKSTSNDSLIRFCRAMIWYFLLLFYSWNLTSILWQPLDQDSTSNY